MKNSPMNRKAMLLLVIALGCCIGTLPLGAQTWDRQVSGTYAHFAGVHFLDAQTGWVCGSAGKVLKTNDGGMNWFLQGGTPGVDLSDVQFVDVSTGWVTGLGGIILKTTDGGTSWSIQSIGTTGWLNCIYFVDAQTGWAAGLYGTILKTTNGGAIWTPQTSGTASTIQKASFTSATNGWMVTSDGRILKTDNGGTTWTQQLLNPPTTLNSVCFLSATVGWIAGGDGKISKTTDGGATWLDQVSGTSQQLNEIVFVNADTGWAAGNGGIVRVTTNGGATWLNQISSTTENLLSLSFLDTRHGYAVGLNNTILEYAIVHSVPIQLASFTATVVSNNSVRLNWTTISEVNNYGFEVERAIGSPSNFETLPGSFIAGHGTTNVPQHYRFTDNAVQSGRLYYRLKQMDLDGTINYTEPISVDVLTGVGEGPLPIEFSLKQNYPNPFNPSTKIEFSIAKAGFVSLKVYDILGRGVATIVNEQLNQGNYAKTFPGDGLSSGVYWYKLTAGNFSGTKKFILSK